MINQMKADSIETMNLGQRKQSISQLQFAYKNKIREIKNDLILKEEEINTLQRTLKYTKILELETEIKEFENESKRLKEQLLQSYKRPVVDLSIHQQILGQMNQKDQQIVSLQQQLTQLNNNYRKKDQLLKKRKVKIQKLRDHIKQLKEKVKAQIKKNMVLQAKMQDGFRFQSRDEDYKFGRSRQGSAHANTSYRTLNVELEEKYKIEQQKCEYLKQKLLDNNISIDEYDLMTKTPISINQLQKIKIILGEQEVMIDRNPDMTLEDIIVSLQESLKINRNQFVLKNEQDQIINSIDEMTQMNDGNLKVFIDAIEDNENVEDDYEEDEFEKFEENKIRGISFEDVQDQFLELKLKSQIKNIDCGKIYKYLLHGIKRDGKKIQEISIKDLQNLFDSRFRFEKQSSLRLARFIVEKPNNENMVVYDENNTISRQELKKVLENYINQYPIYNGLKMTRYISQLTNELEDYSDQIEELFQAKDKYQKGSLTITQIFDILFKDLQLSPFNHELQEFFVFLIFRQSPSVQQINYSSILEIFNEDYLIPPSIHEDKEQYKQSSDSIQQESPSLRIDKNDDQNNELEINENELMCSVDDVLYKIIKVLPPKPVKNLYKQLTPYIKSQRVEDYMVKYINIEDFQTLLKSLLKEDINNRELSCLLHILEKEDQPEVVVFEDIQNIIKNYQRKEKLLQKSLELGVRYDLINSEVLEFISLIKNLNQQFNEREDKDINHLFNKVIKIQTVKTIADEKKVNIIDFEQLMDFLFMKYQIRCPSQKTQDILKTLLCIDEKYPEIILVKKLQKILSDLDYIYVNLYKHSIKPYIKSIIRPKTALAKPVVQRYDQQQQIVKDVKFDKGSSKKNDDDLEFDKFRQKYTMKAEEIEEEDYDEDFNDQEDNEAIMMQDQRKKEKKDNTEKQQKEVGIKDQDKKTKKEKVNFVDENSDSDKGEKMQFNYDEYRKRFTQKPEEVDEEIEDYYE